MPQPPLSPPLDGASSSLPRGPEDSTQLLQSHSLYLRSRSSNGAFPKRPAPSFFLEPPRWNSPETLLAQHSSASLALLAKAWPTPQPLLHSSAAALPFSAATDTICVASESCFSPEQPRKGLCVHRDVAKADFHRPYRCSCKKTAIYLPGVRRGAPPSVLGNITAFTRIYACLQTILTCWMIL